MNDPIDDYLVKRSQQTYEEAQKSLNTPLPRRGFWDVFWDIPHIHIILIFLIVFGYLAFCRTLYRIVGM